MSLDTMLDNLDSIKEGIDVIWGLVYHDTTLTIITALLILNACYVVYSLIKRRSSKTSPSR